MKRNGKSIVSIAAAVAMLFSTFAAAVPETVGAASKGRVKSVKITNVKKKKLTLKKGKTFKLKVKVKVKPNRRKFKKVECVSSNKKVATVSSKGKIKAKKKGTAKISVISKRNKKKKTVVKVTVTDRKDGKENLKTKNPSPSVRPTPTDNSNKKPATASPSASPSPSPSPTPIPTPSPTPDGSSTLSRKPFSGAAVVGKKLSKVAISGGSIIDSNGNEIQGTYTWKNPEQSLEKAGKVYYEADFTPEDSGFAEVKDVSVPVHVMKERLALTAPTASSITTTQSLSEARLYGGNAKNSDAAMVQGSFKWTDSTVVPGKPGTMLCSVTFVPSDKQRYQQSVCYVNVTVTGASSATTQEDKVINLSSGKWKNDTAYDRAWAGNLYSLDSVISGIDMKLYDKMTLTVKLYDTSNQPITASGQGSAVCKLSNSDSWSGFSEMWTTGTATLSLENYAGGTLNLVVQNTTANIGYIEITSMTLNVKKASNVLDGSSLMSAYGDMFGKVGVAIEKFQLTSKNVVNFVKSQYNSLTMGNEMKPDYILGGNPSLSDTNPTGYVDTSTFKNKYKDTKYPKIDMAAIDSYIKTAYENGMKMRYHVFIWHAQSPKWFFKENYSTASSSKYVTADVMNGRLEYLVRNIMTHIYDLKDENGVYIGREVIDSWDVANEYFHNYDKGYKSYWDEVYYPDYEFVKNQHSGNRKPVYIKEAFALADSILKDYGMRDSVSLLFNEFNTYMEADKIVTMINYFNTKDEINPEAEMICDGIGMQTHLDIGYPTVEGIKNNAIEKFRKAGFEIQITEADITAYSKTEVNLQRQVQMWYDFMVMLMQEKESGAKITGVTWWGPSDPTSWRANGVPLLFSDYWQAKEHYFKVIQAASDYNTGEIELE